MVKKNIKKKGFETKVLSQYVTVKLFSPRARAKMQNKQKYLKKNAHKIKHKLKHIFSAFIAE